MSLALLALIVFMTVMTCSSVMCMSVKDGASSSMWSSWFLGWGRGPFRGGVGNCSGVVHRFRGEVGDCSGAVGTAVPGGSLGAVGAAVPGWDGGSLGAVGAAAPGWARGLFRGGVGIVFVVLCPIVM